MAEDPANRAPRIWESIYPYPRHRAAGFGAGRRKAQLQLRIFTRLSPGIRSLHPIEADAPQECIEFTSHVFRSPRFDDVYRAPSYRAWLDASGYDEGYRFHARFLRHLQGPGEAPRRWILKSPEHVFSIDALSRAFPDAMLVLVHRDPGHVLASAARLTELLRAPFTTAIDRREIGRKVADYWQDAMRRMVGSRMIRPFRCAPGSCTCNIARSSPIRLERSRGSTMRSGSSCQGKPGRRWRRKSPGPEWRLRRQPLPA